MITRRARASKDQGPIKCAAQSDVGSMVVIPVHFTFRGAAGSAVNYINSYRLSL